jgi:hypothetical protein
MYSRTGGEKAVHVMEMILKCEKVTPPHPNLNTLNSWTRPSNRTHDPCPSSPYWLN